MRITLVISLLLTSLNLFAVEYGVTRATKKILFLDQVPDKKEIMIEAARNEWEGFQVVIKGEGGLKNVDIFIDDLKSENGGVILSSYFRLYREYYLNITNPSPISISLREREAGFYPDPLIPLRDPYNDGGLPVGAPFDIPDNELGVVFIDLYVPIDTNAGIYRGKVAIFSAGEKVGEIDLRLVVWEFEIPRVKSIGTAYHLDAKKIKYYHGGPEATDESVSEIIKRYFLALHEHRIDPTNIGGSVEFKFDENGELLPIDWTDYDREVSGWIDGTYLGVGVGVTRFNVGYFSPGFGTGPFTEDQFIKASKAFAEHLDNKGWWKRAYIYAIDEPWLNGGQKAWNQIKKDAALLFSGTDLWRNRILVTGPLNPDLKDEVGIWCPVTTMYEDWFYLDGSKAGREEYRPLLESGKELWFYVCMANYPPYAGYDIDTKIGFEPRIVKWGAWYERATGFLYWSVSHWANDDPWNNYRDVNAFGTFARNGDGFLIYPGDHDGMLKGKGSPPDISIDGPVLSYRLKQIRDGFEDWEMFILAERLGAGEYARSQVNRAYKRFGNFPVEDCRTVGNYCPRKQPWTLDDELLYEVRRNIAQKILYLTYPNKYPDPEKGIESVDAGRDIKLIEDSYLNDVVLTESASSGCGCSFID